MTVDKIAAEYHVQLNESRNLCKLFLTSQIKQ